MTDMNLTWLSLAPSIVTLALAFITREVIISLFLGVVTGGIVFFFQTGDLEKINFINVFLMPAMGSKSYASLLIIYLWCLGGILGIWRKTGSAEYFAEKIGKKIAKSARSSMFITWILGMIFHQGGTISTILTGSTIKPISDHNKVSHEELSYIVDATASPGATLIPFNAWPMYVSGVALGSIPLLATPLMSYKFYLSSIPYSFYSIASIALTGLFALGWLPYIGKKMRKAQIRSRKYGLLDDKDASPLLNTYDAPEVPKYFKPSLYEFLIPLGLLLSITITPFLLWRYNLIQDSSANRINEAFVAATVAVMVIAKIRGMRFHDIMEGFLAGCKDMTIGAIIFALALALAVVTQELHTADYLVHLLSGSITPIMLPGLLMIICMITAFSTGTSFGTYAVVYPIALPLAYAINPDPTFIKICFGAVLGGAVFGDQTSPISDTTIFASMFTGCDLMDHVKTQLPLALFAAFCGLLLSTLAVVINGF